MQLGRKFLSPTQAEFVLETPECFLSELVFSYRRCRQFTRQPEARELLPLSILHLALKPVDIRQGIACKVALRATIPAIAIDCIVAGPESPGLSVSIAGSLPLRYLPQQRRDVGPSA